MKKETIVAFYSSYKFYIFPAVVVLSSLFLMVFAIIPQTTTLLNNQKLAQDLVNKSKLLETKVSALESYDNEDLSKKIESALSAFPQDKDFLNILGLLQQLTSQSGFSITSVSLGDGGSKLANTSSYSIKLQVKGARILFQTLLNNIENSPRLVKINSIDISSNQASQGIEASLILEALYSSLPQNFGTADSPLPQITQKEEELLVSLSRTSEAGPSSVVTQSSTVLSPSGKLNPFE